ncbi:class I SAM-dependent methyltransferase [Siphonobacter sp. SORGH_AS_1065]|uniref:class I SAM-dependent methyltransferase n=1 Tax=Siphonobacter sp. SORGH_AS_1065 TaxID=3041795 RepID=UPI00278ACA19|nr:class I SAM-dependent methyltransferase [Siphonobacter sp. SORGH_AS_1065]MDQ1088875.1 23S rRNA (cytosine1962-C5)-methyltransferase [Siphonobacter sp. SORGH_AS_1065]
MKLLTPTPWPDYELIDCGNFEKLERFGAYTLARPEPQAIWDKTLSDAEWEQKAQAYFKREKGNTEKGEWLTKKGMPERWTGTYQLTNQKLTYKLALSSFKHVGLFPEQAANWEFIYQKTKALGVPNPKVLNLFAYTGVASLAAKAAGADVTHVDSVKQVISWSRENMELSELTNIRWVVEDAMKFVKREVRRGNKYHGIILDPPAYGRGPDGEKWVLEEQINELLKLCKELLEPEHHFFLINLYSLSFSALIAESLILRIFGPTSNPEFGELYLPDSFNKKLPLGIFYRFSTVE